MDITLRKCNVCGKMNSSGEDFIRVGGVETSAQKKVPAQQVKIDFCQSCAEATTVNKLADISLSAFKAQLPEHMLKQFEAANVKPAPVVLS